MSSWLDGSLLTEGLKKIEEGLNQVDNVMMKTVHFLAYGAVACPATLSTSVSI